MSVGSTLLTEAKRTKVRYLILFMLFFVTTVNYADRAALSITGTLVAKEFRLDPVAMGFVFSAFGWAYVVAQIPGGWLLDRFGSKKIYALSLLLWSLFTLLQGFVGMVVVALISAVTVMFGLRLLLGLAEAPAFPANSRIVAAWFPASERGTAAAIFNSSQYFALVLFSPIMGSISSAFGWRPVFWFMGVIGFLLAFVWMKTVYDPKDHPSINQAELDYIERGGALVNMDQAKDKGADSGPRWSYIKELLSNRMLLGVYVGQYCISVLTYFFLTWFPIYLIQGRGMSILKVGFVAMLPAICGCIGGVSGGVISDALLKRTKSLTFARKLPIVLGMLLSTSMIVCNYVNTTWIVVGIMALAFFGKGLGALGWAVVSDTSPKQIAGLSGGLFNMFGNVSAITTPIVIGYIVKGTGSFNGALVFVGVNALVTIICYLFVVGEIKRVELKQV